LGLCHLCTGIN